MRLRREDTAYAVATAVATGLVAFLVAGNFGLVPSPFAAPASGELRPVEVPSLQALGASAGPSRVGGVTEVPQIPGLGGPGPGAPPPPPADHIAPAVKVNPAEEPVILSTDGASVTGVASDDRSGVDEVDVTFTPSTGAKSVVPAELSCTAPVTCSWEAAAPMAVGTYTVVATATDKAGNTATDGPYTITIVEAQPDDGLLGSAVDAVSGVAGGLLGLGL